MLQHNRVVKAECVIRILLVCFTLWLPGCSPVAPWERGNLAKPQMELDPYPMQSGLRGHVNSARQGSASGGSAEGGGCGCY